MMTAFDAEELARLHSALLAARAGGAVDARALLAAATTAAGLERWEDAALLARAVLVADPRAARAWALLGTAALRLNRLDEARAALETAVSLDDRDLATALLAAEVQARTGRAAAARALVTYVLLHERGAPELRARASALLDGLAAAAPSSDRPGEPR